MSATVPLSLPEPPAELKAHSQRLKERITSEIRKENGSIGFDRYMDLALYEPGLGYYTAGLYKFGDVGDFITAPETSRVFSWCLASQCRQIMQELDIDVIIEFGAGSGRMACDLLERLKALGVLPDQYLIMETSAELRQRQKELFKEHHPEIYPVITWLDQLPENRVNAIVLANEVMDALPVKRVIIKNGEIFEQKVSQESGHLCYVQEPLTEIANVYCQRYLSGLLPGGMDGYTTEAHINLLPWLKSLDGFLGRGAVLLVDYGYSAREYYSPERNCGTLLCHYRHRAHDDPFWYPGLQDITASVNFTAVSDFAAEHGWNLLGYTTQSGFLLACGLDQIYAEILQSGEVDQISLNREVQALTLPGAMGERFRVMALGRDSALQLQGMNFRDLSHSL